MDSPLPQPVSVILPALLPLILDASNNVRTQLLKLLRALPTTDVEDHVAQLLPYVRAGDDPSRRGRARVRRRGALVACRRGGGAGGFLRRGLDQDYELFLVRARLAHGGVVKVVVDTGFVWESGHAGETHVDGSVDVG